MMAARHGRPIGRSFLAMEAAMTEHSTYKDTARDHVACEIKRVLGQEMMSRRFIDIPPQCRVLQSGVLLIFIGVLMLMLLQQVFSTDPATQIAHQQRGAGTPTGAIGSSAPVSLLERNDP
jgi:hypothetical protein